MDILNHNGAVYVKANVLAKRHRYTTDYIGQLCRQNKVDAQLVGRAWYVTENSLLNHKIDRKKDTRTNEILSKNVIEINTIETPVVQRVNVHPVTSKKTFRQFFNTELPAPINHHWQNRAVAYVDDAATLVPVITNKIRTDLVQDLPENPISSEVLVALAEAESVVVHEATKPVEHLTFTPLPEVPLSGDLAIQNMDTESDFSNAEPITDVDFNPIELPVVMLRSGVTLRYKRSSLPVSKPLPSPIPRAKRLMPAITLHPETVMTKVSGTVPVETVVPPVASLEASSHQRRGPLLLVPALILAAVVFATILLSGSSTLRSDGTTSRESFSFRFSTLESALVFISQIR